MDWITTILGTVVYTLVGIIFTNMTNDHIIELANEVSKIDPRYIDRLWLRVTLVKTPFKELLVDIVFIVFWPAICIAAILKAEWNYDLIVNHSAFVKNGSR